MTETWKGKHEGLALDRLVGGRGGDGGDGGGGGSGGGGGDVERV